MCLLCTQASLAAQVSAVAWLLLLQAAVAVRIEPFAGRAPGEKRAADEPSITWAIRWLGGAEAVERAGSERESRRRLDGAASNVSSGALWSNVLDEVLDKPFGASRGINVEGVPASGKPRDESQQRERAFNRIHRRNLADTSADPGQKIVKPRLFSFVEHLAKSLPYLRAASARSTTAEATSEVASVRCS